MLSCSKKSGTITGEGLVVTNEGFVNKYHLKRHVIAGIVECESSMMKASRTLTDSEVFQHVRCTNDRLESTTGIVFNGPEVKEFVVLTHYNRSSQADDQPATDT